MLSSVLRSQRAIDVNVEIMRAFVRLRHILASNAELARRLDTLEKKYNAQFKVVFDPPAHDAAKARQAGNWLPGGGKRGGLREEKRK
jgi:hypothetical protein